MKITRDDDSTMHGIVQSTKRARTAFVGVALKEDNGIAKLVTRNTNVHESEA
jgi:hypothetical protein